MNSQKLKALSRSLKNLQLAPELKEEMKREALKILQEHREIENTGMIQKLEREFSRARDECQLLIPEALNQKTFGEIIAAGGSFYYDENEHAHVLMVPQEIIPVDATNAPKIPTSDASHRFILGDASSTINKLQASVLKSKRSRLIASTPSHSMTTRKKQDRLSRYSNNSADCSMIYPSAPSYRFATSTVPASAIKSKIRATAKKPSKAVSASKKLAVSAFQFKPPAPVDQAHRSTALKMDAISPIVNPSDSDPSVNLTLLNPKTPSGKNRLFKKQLRRAEKDEVIVHCSTSGTPLIVDSEKQK